MTDDPTDVGSLSDRIAAGAQFYRRPGARLSEPQSDAVERISETPAAYHAGYHAFDLAHAVMLVEEGLIPDEEGRAILRGLRELEDDDGDATDARAALGHGVHNGEAYLISEYGEDVGGWLHLGRSSHDLHGTAVRFVLRERLLEIGELLAELLETYADRAAETADAPIPTYTGLQHAQVGTIGFQLCAAAAPHGRDLERVVALYDRLNRSPAGAAVGTTSDFDLNRERVASLLGFDGLLTNAEDVDKSVDQHLETGATLATVATNVGAAADRFLLWYSREFDVLDLPDRLCGTSSIMPQKKNPHSIETVQRETNGVIGEATEQYVAAKNLAGGVGVSPSTLADLATTLETWVTVVSGVSFDAERATELVTDDWALATDLAALLVREGDLPWRSAHQVVAILVRRFEESGRTIADLAPEDVAEVTRDYRGTAVDVSAEALAETLDPMAAVERRAETPGSPAPSQVRDQVATLRETASTYRESFAERRDALAAARDRRRAAVDALVEE